jgi:hypothetical protein
VSVFDRRRKKLIEGVMAKTEYAYAACSATREQISLDISGLLSYGFGSSVSLLAGPSGQPSLVFGRHGNPKRLKPSHGEEPTALPMRTNTDVPMG